MAVEAVKTQSLCPRCLRRIEAWYTVREDAVFLEKRCPDHGDFSVRVWQGEEDWNQWRRPKSPIQDRFSMTPVQKGCPFDCGLCPDHGQHTCTAVLDITRQCNLSCRFCFAGSVSGPGGPDPDPASLQRLMEKVSMVSPDCSLQLSGGEPTLREDLPQIVAAARETGFPFIQLNTNGLKLGQDPELAPRLREAGLTSVFLQFDGVSDRIYEGLRGRPLAAVKERAVQACAGSGIGVVLVPTLVPGINESEIGAILQFGLDHAPGVRGIHFQPVSYFGRIPGLPGEGERLTIPEVLAAIQEQTGGRFRRSDFKPSSCEHALCSFSGKYLVDSHGTPRPLTLFGGGCCTPAPAEEGARKARASVRRHWKAPAVQYQETCCSGDREDGLYRFIRQADRQIFTVSGMAFQDAWTLDLERLKGCCIHAVAPDGRLIPFCAYNLTRADGKGLYREAGNP